MHRAPPARLSGDTESLLSRLFVRSTGTQFGKIIIKNILGVPVDHCLNSLACSKAERGVEHNVSTLHVGTCSCCTVPPSCRTQGSINVDFSDFQIGFSTFKSQEQCVRMIRNEQLVGQMYRNCLCGPDDSFTLGEVFIPRGFSSFIALNPGNRKKK